MEVLKSGWLWMYVIIAVTIMVGVALSDESGIKPSLSWQCQTKAEKVGSKFFIDDNGKCFILGVGFVPLDG